MRKMILRAIALISILSIICVGALFLYVSSYPSEYRSWRAILLYKDENGSNRALLLELVKFSDMIPYRHHYRYMLLGFGEGRGSLQEREDFEGRSSAFESHGFVTKLENENNENTLDESFLIEMKSGSGKIRIDLKNLKSDFLVNNSPERFSYENLGTTRISLGGKAYEADYILTKAYERRTLKANYENRIISKGQVTLISDLKGDICYSDITDVYASKSDYISHSWAICKNKGMMMKDSGKGIRATEADDGWMRMKFEKLGGREIVLGEKKAYENSIYRYGLSLGNMKSESGEKPIVGFSITYDDRKKE